MSKTTYIVAILLCSILSYGQQIKFHKNVNYRASVLEQSLENNGDVLVLESKNNHILQIDIFNEFYSKSLEINDTKTKINLKTLPIGNYVIQAKVDKKWIVMYLEKMDETPLTSKNSKDRYLTHTLNEADTITNSPNETKKVNYYWVVYESNSSFGSRKSMRLEYKEDIARIIYKNKLELKSSVGKNNKLTIYEVYNTSEFMPNQLKNPSYYETGKSEAFNAIPYYTSVDTNQEGF
ncbi:hypothetical protein AB9K26_04375 [Psychroserpens sp. XS_ASV72]|uniref:hypothetical protein n=1 Tax=Psychroserpens sp. XS_ASV72 TaxID=3241293 RepID=UPI0035177797